MKQTVTVHKMLVSRIELERIDVTSFHDKTPRELGGRVFVTFTGNNMTIVREYTIDTAPHIGDQLDVCL